MSTKKSLPSLPPLPSKARNRVPRYCECGCGNLCGNRFVPGHDSTLRAWTVRVERRVLAPNGDTLDNLLAIPHDGIREAVALNMKFDLEGALAERAEATDDAEAV